MLLVILKSFKIVYEESAVNCGQRGEWLDKWTFRHIYFWFDPPPRLIIHKLVRHDSLVCFDPQPPMLLGTSD